MSSLASNEGEKCTKLSFESEQKVNNYQSWTNDRLAKSGKRKRSLKLRRSKCKVNVERLSEEDSPFEEITNAQKDKYEKKYIGGDASMKRSIKDLISSSADNDSEVNSDSVKRRYRQCTQIEEKPLEGDIPVDIKQLSRIADEIKESVFRIEKTVKEIGTSTTISDTYKALSQINHDLKGIMVTITDVKNI